MRMTTKLSFVLFALLGIAGCATTDPNPKGRQAEIATQTECAQNTELDSHRSAQCAVDLAIWASEGWGTPDGKPDKKQFYSWMHKAADKGNISAAVDLARLYVLHFATGKYESDKAIELITPAYDLYLSGVIDPGRTKEYMARVMAAGLTYRGLGYALKKNVLASRKDYCRALALDPSQIQAARWLRGGYGFESKCKEYLQQDS